MCKIWIFGGTTEGRLLAEYCSREKIEAWVSVASEYGEELLQEELHFDYIREFNHLKALSVLGSAAADLSKPVLMEIGRTIRAYERQRKKEEKSLANTNAIDYNALKHKSEKQK